MARVMELGRRAHATVLFVSIAALTACTSGPPVATDRATGPAPSPTTAPPGPVRVVVFVDSSVPDSLELVASAQLAMQLAFTRAEEAGALPSGSEVLAFDTGGDAATGEELAREAAADPRVVAAVEGPFWSPIPQAREVLAQAEVPIVSLSSLGEPAPAGTWLRIVPSLLAEARTIAGEIPQEARACVIGDGTAYSELATRSVLRAFRRSGDRRPRRVEDVDATRCRHTIWTGAAIEGAELATALHDAEPRVSIVLTAIARTESFLEGVDSARAVTAVCGCVDLSTATSDGALELLHDFQRSHGISLGPYGVEGWDLGRALVGAIGPDGADRPDVAAALAALRRIEGVGGTYTIGSDRERSDPIVHVYRATSTRWLPLDGR